MIKVNPKCKYHQGLSYTATGYILPCCWCDNPLGWQEPQIKRLRQQHLKLENNDKVEDIVYSKEWKNFMEELETNPAKTCQRFCGTSLDLSINESGEEGNIFRRYTSTADKQKIKICCVYFKGKYTPDYVEKLYNGLKRHCTIPFEFTCYSDNPNVKADIVIPLPNPKYTDIKYHWYKLSFFSSLFANQKPGDEIIIIDIDQVIVNNIDDMIGWPVADNELVSYNKWWGKKRQPKIQGGFIKFKSGVGNIIWDSFIENPEYWQLYYYNKNEVHYKYFGEQNFIEWIAKKNDMHITLMEPEWVGIHGSDKKQNLKNNRIYMKEFKEDYMIMDKPNPKIKIVHFTNPLTTIHQCKNDWIKDHWK